MKHNGNQYQEVRLPRDTDKDMVFEGRLIAEVSSDPANLGDRWTELALYQTKGGKFVAYSVGKSNLPGEGDIPNCEAYPSAEAAAEFFKRKGRITWLSVEMYSKIKEALPDFDVVERVE